MLTVVTLFPVYRALRLTSWCFLAAVHLDLSTADSGHSKAVVGRERLGKVSDSSTVDCSPLTDSPLSPAVRGCRKKRNESPPKSRRPYWTAQVTLCYSLLTGNGSLLTLRCSHLPPPRADTSLTEEDITDPAEGAESPADPKPDASSPQPVRSSAPKGTDSMGSGALDTVPRQDKTQEAPTTVQAPPPHVNRTVPCCDCIYLPPSQQGGWISSHLSPHPSPSRTHSP